MRPPKRILLIDADEERQSVTRFMLEINRFTVISANSVPKAPSHDWFDVVIGYWPVDAGAMDKLARKQLHAKSMLVAPAAVKDPSDAVVDAVILKGQHYAANILETAKTLTARKRGPVKGSCRKIIDQAA